MKEDDLTIAEAATQSKPTDNLALDVVKFASDLPYWAKYLAEKILKNGQVTTTNITDSYSYLLEELKLSEVLEKEPVILQFPETNAGIHKKDLVFKRLSDVVGVNALVENQTIDFNPNLTIIYGSNGSGKSGYVRLMKKVFYSKSPEEILGNVNLPIEPKNVTASFHFSANSKEYIIKCPDDQLHQEFQQYSVFDDASVLSHLEQKNEFRFRPAGLSFFAKLSDAILEIEKLLNVDIGKKRIGPSLDDLSSIYEGDSTIKELILGLSARTDLSELKKILPFTSQEKEELTRIQKEYDELLITSRGIEKEISSLSDVIAQLATRRKSVDSLNELTSESAIAQLELLVSNLASKESLAKSEGIEMFRTVKVSQVGSPEWKAFISSATKFAISQSSEVNQYPQRGDNCLFCLQPLSEDSIELIHNYWAFLRSVAEENAVMAKAKVSLLRKTLSEVEYNLFPKENTVTVWLAEKKPGVLNNMVQKLVIMKVHVQEMIAYIDQGSKEALSAYQIDDSDLKEAEEFANKTIEVLKSGNQFKELEKIKKRITYLIHKEKFETNITKVEDYVTRQLWIEKSSKANLQKRRITDGEKNLSERYFNQKYVDLFNQECSRLNGCFGISVNHSGSGGKTYRQLRLKGRNPNSVLSEGEQKVIALADFFTESKMSEINKGLIFDDPVNSLDERRKGEIATRLVEESNIRQIIIFTHDLVFVSSLLSHFEIKSGKFNCHWVENRENKPGQIWLNNAPCFEREYRNSEPAKKLYQEAVKPDCAPKEREVLVKSGFTALRTCYEVLVINDLFKNVVQRFSERVSVDALSDVYFNQDLVMELQDSFYQCCRYMEGHSHSDRYAYKRPEPTNLNDEILRYEAIKNKVKKSKKKVESLQSITETDGTI